MMSRLACSQGTRVQGACGTSGIMVALGTRMMLLVREAVR